MRISPAIADDGGRTWGRALGLALVAALGMTAVLPLAARPQDEPPAAEADAPDPKAQAEEGTPAAEETPEPSDKKTSESHQARSGTATYSHIEEVETKKTADGEIEIQRVREPNYSGDTRVRLEREVRTRKLPDGTIEKEYVIRNPDGSGRMMPIEIIREKIRTNGEATTTEREVLRQDYSGHWQPQRKERVTETGEEKDRKSVKEVREKNLSGDWKVVDRTVTSEKVSESGRTARAVRQTPNAYGELADYEVREENTNKDGDKESKEVVVRRRDTQDTHNPKFFLAERTRTEQTKAADGKVTRKSVTESDLQEEGASRNVTPGSPKVVQEKVEVETTAADGSTRRTVSVKERGAVDRDLRPTGQIVQGKDSKGNVRQILIPSR